MNVIYFTTLLTVLSHLSAFNLDYEYTVVKNGPKDSFFGFSVAEHLYSGGKWILVGAPKSNSTSPRNVEKSGTVFKCDATKATAACDGEVPFDSSSTSKIESTKNQWLGVSLKSGGDLNSVVSCAHRYQYYRTGGKYRLLEGRCHIVDEDLETRSGYYNPCRSENIKGTGTTDMKNYGQCLFGVGLDIHKSNLDGAFDAGALGAKWFQGRYYKYTDDARQEAPMLDIPLFRDSYFGYAVASGLYTQKNTKEVAVGGPRHQSFGKVIIYKDIITTVYNTSVAQILPASDDSYDNEQIQIASGFGIALCSIDSDGNGYDELVVGAPFYAADRKTPDSGLVYVYERSDSEPQLVVKNKFYGKIAGGNFGYAVANGGDLNLDGYADLAVGAPHVNDGKGAVYIYRGTKKGLSEEVAQVIRAENVHSGLSNDPLDLAGFGRSMAGGIDMDGNTYPDLLVGSYISDQAVLLRSRPIVIPKSTMTFSPKEINTDNKNCDIGGKKTVCFTLSFCHNITEPHNAVSTKNITIQYSIIADSANQNNPRVVFEDQTNKFVKDIESSGTTACLDIEKLHLNFDNDGTVAEYPDVSFEVHFGMEPVRPDKDPNAVVNLDTYPVLDPQSSLDGIDHVVYTELKFKRECETCIPDLKFLATPTNYTLRLGSKRFLLNITIVNVGKDPAYAVKLAIKVPPSIDAESITDKGKKKPPCNFPKGACENLIPKLGSNKSEQFEISLNTQRFRPGNENNLTIIISSINTEDPNTEANNVLEITFDTQVVADVELLGVQTAKQIGYKGEIKGESAMVLYGDAGKVVEYKFAVRNNGPDLLPSVNLTIDWPVETLSGKHLLYLINVQNSSNFQCSTPVLNQAGLRRSSSSSNEVPKTTLAPLSDTTSNDDSESTRVRRDTEVVGDANSTSEATTSAPPVDNSVVNPDNERTKSKIVGKPLDCSKGTAKCEKIRCTILNLEKDQAQSVTIISILWEPSLFIDYYGEVLTIVSNAKVELGEQSWITDPNLNDNEIKLYTVVTPEVVKDKDGIPIWIIALAVVAGVILLALLIFGLHKLGFFKRNRGTQHSAKSKPQEKSLLSK